MMRQGFVSSVFLELLAREFLLPQAFTQLSICLAGTRFSFPARG